MSNLNAWTVGVSFPLFFFPQQSRSKQAKIALRIAEWEADDNRFKLKNKVEELQRQARMRVKDWIINEKAALNEARELHRSALLKYEESEVDIAGLVQSLNAARDDPGRDILRRYMLIIFLCWNWNCIRNNYRNR